MSGMRVWERHVTARIAYLVPTCTYKYQGTSKSKHVTIVNLCSVLCPLFHREWRIKPCVDCAHFLVVNLDVRRCHPAILVSFVILWSEVLICDYMGLYGILWWKTFRHFYIQYLLIFWRRLEWFAQWFLKVSSTESTMNGSYSWQNYGVPDPHCIFTSYESCM